MRSVTVLIIVGLGPGTVSRYIESYRLGEGPSVMAYGLAMNTVLKNCRNYRLILNKMFFFVSLEKHQQVADPKAS